jgi:hypothetical protein
MLFARPRSVKRVHPAREAAGAPHVGGSVKRGHPGADDPAVDGSSLRALATVVPVAAIASWALWTRLKRAGRGDDLRRMAHSLGLEYADGDVLGCDRLNFAALHPGGSRDDGGIDHLVFGTARGRAVRLFDVWWRRRDDDQVESRRTCALADLRAIFPRLRIEPAGAFDRGDVHLEWTEFHEHFVVHTDDERFAYTLLDEPMMEFLVKVARGSTVELAGSFVCFSPGRELDPADWPRLVTFLVEFAARVPRAVWHLYPAPGAPERGADGTPAAPPPLPPVEVLYPTREHTGEFDWTTGRLDWPELPRLGPGADEDAP